MVPMQKTINVEISYCRTNEKFILSFTGLLVIAMNMNGGSTTKNANRASVLPLSWVNQPSLQDKLPKKIIIKNGVVIVRISTKVAS